MEVQFFPCRPFNDKNMKQKLADKDLQRMIDGADLAEEKAERLAAQLTRDTRKYHYIKECHYTGLVGGSDWWEVRRLRWFVCYTVVASYWSPDGEERSCFV